VIRDARERGRSLAVFFLAVGPELFRDLEDAGLVEPGEPARERAQDEWECFALYACVRGLVAAGGFGLETVDAVDSLHEAVAERWGLEGADPERLAARRARVAARYAEYGEIGQAAGKNAALASRRLAEAAARHMAGPSSPAPELVETVGALHDALAEGAAEAVRRAGHDGTPEG